MEGARELIEDLRQLGHRVVLASSAKQDEVERYLDQLEAREIIDAWTTSADVESTKPEPDLVHAALERVHGSPEEAVMVGDTSWDVEAARRAGVDTLAVLTGGFAAQELRDAGAVEVFESVNELRSGLSQTPLRSSQRRAVARRSSVRARCSPQESSIDRLAPTIWLTVSPW